MKKRLLFVGIVLSLILTMVVPGTAVAARPHRLLQPFDASGTFLQIDEGNVSQFGNSGYWLVRNRHLWGTLTEGSIEGDVTITYGAVVDVTQAGWFAGNMVVEGGYKAFVSGSSGSAMPTGIYYGGLYPVYSIELNGSWLFTRGATGGGSFYGNLAFVPTEDGAHIAFVVSEMSSLRMTGRWCP